MLHLPSGSVELIDSMRCFCYTPHMQQANIRSNEGHHPAPSAAPLPRILLVGEAHHTRPARNALSALPYELVEAVDLREALDRRLDPATVAVVLVSPLRGLVPEHAVSLVAERRAGAGEGAWLHIFVIAPDDFPDARTAMLYKRGASGVLSWAADAERLPSIIENTLHQSPGQRGAASGNRSLARLVRTRLRAAGTLDGGVRMSVRQGVVRLAGRVRRLWKRRSLRRELDAMPGITSVESDELVVAESGRPDARVASDVRALLQGAATIDERTLAVSVHDGHVVVHGTVLAHEEWLHAADLISMIEGVGSVTNLTAESPGRKQRDGHAARRLAERVREQIGGSDRIDVAVLGGAAVLRGQVPQHAVGRAAEEIVAGDETVELVVNRLCVA